MPKEINLSHIPPSCALGQPCVWEWMHDSPHKKVLRHCDQAGVQGRSNWQAWVPVHMFKDHEVVETCFIPPAAGAWPHELAQGALAVVHHHQND